MLQGGKWLLGLIAEEACMVTRILRLRVSCLRQRNIFCLMHLKLFEVSLEFKLWPELTCPARKADAWHFPLRVEKLHFCWLLESSCLLLH